MLMNCSFQVKCFEFILAIVYILLVALLVGWALFTRTGEMKEQTSSMEPLLNSVGEDGTNSGHVLKDKKRVQKVEVY